MSRLPPQALQWALRILTAAVLAVVFVTYFQADLVIDLANLLWRCA